MATSQMRLTAFRVTEFRSVKDSGWIDASDITALIGTNESGKTNLLLPLWKLNPAKEGEIKLIADAPRKDYNTIRQAKSKPVFITARFTLNDTLAQQVAAAAGVSLKEVQEVEVSRDLSGARTVMFPKAKASQSVAKAEAIDIIAKARKEIEGLQSADDADAARKVQFLAAIEKASQTAAKLPDALKGIDVDQVRAAIDQSLVTDAPSGSAVSARFVQLGEAISKLQQKTGKPSANDCQPAKTLVSENLPVFVYYTTYGNLDSEIYLPHVIEDLKRSDLTGRSEARARTLRVLFDFVKLKPEEILELGKDWNDQQGRPNDAQIQSFNEKKKERSVLLQSAGTDLTKKFREWWKQGEYRMRFEADGNHFRIWVSDDKRPEEIELEGRSTGLQWFLSFYLIFLVESRAAHHGAILLLDEPGHSLHPLAQKELSKFFDHLSQANQLLYTTHSPFLIDADHLDRARNVYVNEEGNTVASADLRAGPVAAQSRSAYPAHASLGLSVSDTLFQGCRPIVVEGQSDQFYLSAIKNLLIAHGRFKPAKEILFVPTSGAKAIKTVASILGGRDEDLPMVLCDSDAAGVTLAKNLKEEMYSAVPERVMLVGDFASMSDAEVEDLIPKRIMGPILDRFLRGPQDHPFTPGESEGAIVPLVKAYAKRHGIVLGDGWKVDLARLVKGRLAQELAAGDWEATLVVWDRLFSRMSGTASAQLEVKVLAGATISPQAKS